MDISHQTTDAAEAPPVNRYLVGAVYVMGALLVISFVGLIGGVVYKIATRTPAPESSGLVELGLPASASVREATLNGDRLTINTGTEVFIVEVSSRKVLLRVNATAP